MSFLKAVPLAVLSVLLHFNAATAQNYACKINAAQSKGWIPETVHFNLDTTRNSVIVADPYTLHTKKSAATVPLRVNTDKRAKFTWQTGRLRSSHGDEVTMIYIATYLKKKNLLLIYAKPRGFHEDFTGRGKCAISKS